MVPFPDSLKLSMDSAEALKSRRPERFETHTDHDPTKFDLFGRPVEQ